MILDDWTVEIVFKQQARDQGVHCDAFITWTPGYHTAVLTVGKDSYDAHNEREMDVVIVHELSHLLGAKTNDTLKDYIGEGRVYDLYVKSDETNCDKFAKILVRAYARKRES